MNSLFQDTKRQLTGDLHELKKNDQILGTFTILLYYDRKDALLEIIQCPQLGACAIG